jgi:hypothetical protein
MTRGRSRGDISGWYKSVQPGCSFRRAIAHVGPRFRPKPLRRWGGQVENATLHYRFRLQLDRATSRLTPVIAPQFRQIASWVRPEGCGPTTEANVVQDTRGQSGAFWSPAIERSTLPCAPTLPGQRPLILSAPAEEKTPDAPPRQGIARGRHRCCGRQAVNSDHQEKDVFS